jgi:hypothetical protein
MTSVITRLLSLALFACLMASVMSAGSIAPCPTASVAAYEALTGPCQIGSLEFSDFAYTNTFFPTLPGPAASAVMVTPTTNPADPGLDLSASWTVSNGSGMDSALTYLVMSISGAPIMDQADFGMTATVNSGVSIQVSETLCIGIALGPGKCPDPDELVVDIPSTGSQQTSVTFAPVSELTISNDIYIRSTGSSPDDGTGSISSVTNTLPLPSTTPEPATLLLGLSGLLVLGQMTRVARRQRQRS